MIPPAVSRCVEAAVELLAARRYDVLERVTSAQRLTADQMRTAVEEYGRTLVMLPENWQERATVVEPPADRPTYLLTVDLYTAEEGPSDLSIELEVVEVAPGLWDTRVDDIRTL